VEIPLFPLPNVVLFPNVLLPLHIFEDRYKQMINGCIDAAEPFGLLLLREGAQEETEQTIHRVGTTARVIEVERLESGRMNILCQGETRFKVLRFTDSEPFWKGKIDFLEDQTAAEESLEPLVEEVSSLYGKAFQLGIQLNEISASELRLPASPVELSYMISYVLGIESEEKQKLLEMRSTEDRLRALLVYVDETIRRLEQQVVYKQVVHKVRGNGDLGKPGSGQH
jgi:Lon protease-like protein